MRRTALVPLAVAALLAPGAELRAQPAPAGEAEKPPVLVTPDNFTRAESDMYFAAVVQEGGFGKLSHKRTLMPIEKQSVVRSNRDTLYSSAVFDLDAGPVTIALPDAGPRFMSLQAIDEDHYVVAVAYGAGSTTFERAQVGTRYLMIGIRTLVDPVDPKDLQRVHALQDAIEVHQGGGPGSFDVPRWDAASQKSVRDALLALGETMPDSRRTFGAKDQVEPVRHLIGTAIGWGGNPEKDALYLTVTPDRNDGSVVHRLRVRDVPVDGFWSISVYDSDGYFEKNAAGAYSLNDLTAMKDGDGSVTVQFGGCEARPPNCLPIVPQWNYTVRLYRPRPEILDGSWSFPKAEPAQ